MNPLERLLFLEAHAPEDPQMALIHLRAMYQQLAVLATDAAEEKWPGFKKLAERLIDTEHRLGEVDS